MVVVINVPASKNNSKGSTKNVKTDPKLQNDQNFRQTFLSKYAQPKIMMPMNPKHVKCSSDALATFKEFYKNERRCHVPRSGCCFHYSASHSVLLRGKALHCGSVVCLRGSGVLAANQAANQLTRRAASFWFRCWSAKQACQS